MPYILLFVLGCIGYSISYIGLNISYIQQLDQSILHWISLHRTDFFDHVSITLSYIGGLPVMLLLCGICCLQQAYLKKYANVILISVSLLGASGIGWILKACIHRPRPEAVYQMVQTYGASFPSAHSIYAAVIACLIIFIFFRHTQAKLLMSFAYLWCLSMGISRVYVGAHFLTDVLAGWSIGLLWVSLIWYLFSKYMLNTNKLFLDKNLNEVE
ncbi:MULTISPECIES: phosphatase PAP2 family protein [Acinetobacter]|uniref:undecaprenyl-diphosphate phosphatase n=1 Tax=Acinetobacter piscicola TaxID=2006115 RepID=A0A4Q4H2F7_9GAMM|nr:MULTISPECIES: phosphatase PAP2 family protein [Acinetobacter]MDM1756131.1 phosphatase PAP2 family protein [Acinetobacter sp. 256-1]QOW45355.1 phosphatase PAP2 family protein [Acinetobacter piscicola]RYL28595.1 phosphatase PAP2 family protein [Acinetobacter piscicola]